MRTLTLLVVALISISLQAQKVKIKNGEILLDKNKVGFIEKVKVKGANNYFKIIDNEKNHLFNAKLVSEESKFFETQKRSNYFIIECVKQKDSIGIENLGFYLGEKRVVKYLLKNGILTTNGFDNSKTDEILSTSESKPSYAQDKDKKDVEYIKNVNYLIPRDTSNPLFVEKIKTSLVTGYGIIDGKSVQQTKYELFQGENKSNKTLIGYAYLEIPDMGRSKLIIVNTKDCPIGYFNNAKHYTFYPLSEIDVKLSSMKRLDKPVEAIYQFVQLLVEEKKL